jgi:hypothetical protein
MTELSVIMTVFNGGPYLAPAVSSLLDQTYSDFELIILNNGSTDDSLHVLRSFSDSRIRILDRESTVPRTDALNLALASARGRLVAVQDADDLSLPDRLKEQMRHMAARPETALIGTWVEFISANGETKGFLRPPAGHEELVKAICRYNPFLHSSVIYNRETVLRLGGYPSEFVYAQDFALWLRLMRKCKVAILPKILVKARVHSNQMGELPEHQLLRAREILQLMESAATSEGNQTPGRNAGVVEAMFDYGMALFKNGRFREAMPWLARSCLRHPHFWLVDTRMRKSLLRRLVGARLVKFAKKRFKIR